MLITHKSYIYILVIFYTDQSSEKSQNAKEIEKMHTKELKRILNKVDEMRMQRLELHNKLRDQIAQDDLTRLLVTATSESAPLDRLFAEQLSKHESLVSKKFIQYIYIHIYCNYFSFLFMQLLTQLIVN